MCCAVYPLDASSKQQQQQQQQRTERSGVSGWLADGRASSWPCAFADGRRPSVKKRLVAGGAAPIGRLRQRALPALIIG